MLLATCEAAKLSSCARKLGSSAVRSSLTRCCSPLGLVAARPIGSSIVALRSMASRAVRNSARAERSAAGSAAGAASRSAPRSSASAAATLTAQVARPSVPAPGSGRARTMMFSQLRSSTSLTIVLAGVLNPVGR